VADIVKGAAFLAAAAFCLTYPLSPRLPVALLVTVEVFFGVYHLGKGVRRG
jgi:hypothetical protein